MGNCFSNDNNKSVLIPLLISKDADIELLRDYTQSLENTIVYLNTNKSDIHDKYIDQLEFNKVILDENKKLKEILLQNGITFR